MKLYFKFAAQVVVTALTALVAFLADDRVDASEWRNVGIVALAAVGVLGAGELPAGVWSHMKAYVAAASAAMVFWESAAFNGMSSSEWVQMIIVIIGALGVAALPGPKVVTAREYNLLHQGLNEAGLNPGPK